MAYQVTFTLNSAYTGTTQADDFTIVAKHSGGSPADDTLATGVTKAALIAGVTYTVADTVTGGTVTSTGVCTNSVTWSGLNAAPPSPPSPTATPQPTSEPDPGTTLYRFSYCGGVIGNNPSAGSTVAFYGNTLTSAGMGTLEPVAGDTITLSGSGNAGAVWEYTSPGGLEEYAFETITGFNGTACPGPQQ
jgi:hypothetical protein